MLDLLASDAAIRANADNVASKHISNMHSCTILAWGVRDRGGRGGGVAKVISNSNQDPVHLSSMHITLFMQAAGVSNITLQARAVQRVHGTATDIHTQKLPPQPGECKQRGGWGLQSAAAPACCTGLVGTGLALWLPIDPI